MKTLPFTFSTLFFASGLVLVGAFWFSQVAVNAPEPYLDEVFHVRQALVYWNHQWRVWDPKITTPPGLYLLSYPALWLQNLLHVPFSLTVQLRSLNLVAGVFLTFIICRNLLFHISKNGYGSPEGAIQESGERKQRYISVIDHTVLNICLFPPLFFFYGLYYTDVFSTLQVLHAYLAFQEGNVVKMLSESLIALSLRQTNIFWTATFLSGLEVVRTLKKGRTGAHIPLGSAFGKVIQHSWQIGAVYDPLVNEAYFEDYFKCGLSIVVSTLANLQLVLTSLIPYISLLSLFTGFVIWNGGVVLGDKDNHTVSLHISQMLYLWPYITFFSFPLLYPRFLSLGMLLPLPQALRNHLRNALPHPVFPRLLIAIPTLVLMTLTVHYNTLIHPFTLADNRHYTFYVFRILALRNPATKYLAVPLYFLCLWAAISAFSGSEPIKNSDVKNAFLKPKSRAQPVKQNKEKQGATTSLLLILLLTITLSLITAPLVEPRYFILPWVLWRLHLPLPLSPTTPSWTSNNSSPSPISTSTHLITAFNFLYANRLYLETIYFLLVNLFTGYIFLHWGFGWPSEPGKVQRFMW